MICSRSLQAWVQSSTVRSSTPQQIHQLLQPQWGWEEEETLRHNPGLLPKSGVSLLWDENTGLCWRSTSSQAEEIPPCAMFISHPNEAVRDSLLSICSQISTHQPVSRPVRCSGVTCNSLVAPRLVKPVTVVLDLSVSYQKISCRFFSVSWLNVTAEKLYSIWIAVLDESQHLSSHFLMSC